MSEQIRLGLTLDPTCNPPASERGGYGVYRTEDLHLAIAASTIRRLGRKWHGKLPADLVIDLRDALDIEIKAALGSAA